MTRPFPDYINERACFIILNAARSLVTSNSGGDPGGDYGGSLGGWYPGGGYAAGGQAEP